MRKLRFVKVIIPEVVAVLFHGSEKIPDYRCAYCGSGVDTAYTHCPYCGAELYWKDKDKLLEAFLKSTEE